MTSRARIGSMAAAGRIRAHAPALVVQAPSPATVHRAPAPGGPQAGAPAKLCQPGAAGPLTVRVPGCAPSRCSRCEPPPVAARPAPPFELQHATLNFEL